MSDLMDKVGNRLENQNKLLDRTTIRVYVENEDDVPFWKYFFTKANIDTVISPASKGNLERGKKTVLFYENQANASLLLCVDSDYDYFS